MNHAINLESQIRKLWDQWNNEGIILYRSDTLTTRTITHEGIELHLMHNACRDVYDRSPKSIEQPTGKKIPFSDGSNPELARTDDQQFKILGNRFACMQYQSILVPVETQEVLTEDFLQTSLRFAVQHPRLTLMYNAINAGKTVSHQYWLLSFHNYATLDRIQETYKPIGTIGEVVLQTRETPCYMITFNISKNKDVAVKTLYRLICFMEHKNFNLFLFSTHVYFIPREDVEIPTDFENHRFGGLEMIGYFIMKSAEALESANPTMLLKGIHQISYRPANQKHLEQYLLQE